MTPKKDFAGHLQLALIALIFFGPLFLAAGMYFTGASFQPAGRTNNGDLLQPVIPITDELPDSSLLDNIGGRWLLIYSNSGACEDACKRALYILRQLRLTLGNDMERLGRVLLRVESAPDTVVLGENYAGTIILIDDALGEWLQAKKPEAAAPGGYFLADPLGNLVMYFSPEMDPGAMVEDIEHLLELSRIG
jgi:hypothetical protein